MKKFTAIILALITVFILASCNKSSSKEPVTTDDTEDTTDAGSENLEGSLKDILTDIYDKAKKEKDMSTAFDALAAPVDIDPKNCSYYFGVETLDFKEGIASEPEMGGAYSVCLIRANSVSDVEQLKTTIKGNVNPYKWVCMGVEDKNVVVDSIGDVVILIMSVKSEFIHAAFLDLAK
jgi:hypothetical protein